MVETKKIQTPQEMEEEFKRLELEIKRYELLDVKERVDERRMKRDTKEQRTRLNGQVLENNLRQRLMVQAHCNHRKGGSGLEGYVGGQGDDPQFSVFKHQFLNGDIWVRCLRCGKWWKPPIEDNYYFDSTGKEVAKQDGKFDKGKFEKAWEEYRLALAFPTRNSMSTSYTFKFSDGGDIFRTVTKDTEKV